MESPIGLDKVCELIGKKPADLARDFSISDAAVSQWREKGFPPQRAIELEKQFPGVIKAADLHVADAQPRGPRKKAAA